MWQSEVTGPPTPVGKAYQLARTQLWCVLFLLLALVSGSIALATDERPCDGPPNLVANCGFEQGKASRRLNPNSTGPFEIVEDGARSGAKAAALSAEQYTEIRQLLNISPQGKYRLSGYLLWTDPEYEKAGIGIRFGMPIGSAHDVELANQSEKWERLESRWLSAGGATEAVVYLRVQANGKLPDQPVLFDDIVLEEQLPPPPTVEPTRAITPGPTVTVAPTHTPIPTSSPTAEPTSTPTPEPTRTPTPQPTDTPPPSPTPPPERVSIAEARTRDGGEPVSVRGIITAPAHTLGAKRLYVQDDSGGILVMVPQGSQTYEVGRVVEVTGIPGSYFGERAIRTQVDGGGVTARGAEPEPEPREIASGDVGPETEGSLVRIEGTVAAVAKPNVRVDDGSGEARVRVAGSTDIVWPSPRKHDQLTAVGIVSSFNGSYRPMPRYDRDLVVVRHEPPPTPTQEPSATPTPEPPPPLVSISAARADNTRGVVRIRGSVTAPAHLLGKRRLYIQDGAAGILVVVPEGEGGALRPGSMVEVTGKPGTYFGERALRDGRDVTLLATRAPPTPRKLSTGHIGVATEGLLVEVRGPVTQVAKPSVRLNDGSGEARIRISPTTGLAWPSPRKHDTLTAVGVVSSFNGHYRVLPRYRTDLRLVRHVPPEPLPRDATVGQARAASERELLRVQGVVTAPPGPLGEARFWLQDATGGILVTGARSQALKSGDRVRVTGESGAAYGERLLRLKRVERLGSGPEPRPVSVALARVGARTEGLLVAVEGPVAESAWPSVYIGSPDSPVRVYARESTGLGNPRARRGDSLHAVGIVSGYRGKYRVLPFRETHLRLTRHGGDDGDDGGDTTDGTAPKTWRDVSLHEVARLTVGTRVRFEAQVTAPPGVLGDARAYVGASGAGIALHSPKGGYPRLSEGDWVRVRGELDTYHGERIIRLKGSDVLRLGAGELLRPVSTGTGSVGASLQGQLVRVRAPITRRQWPTLQLDDGTGQTRVRVMESTAIPRVAGGRGDTANVVGIVSQWDGRYRLLPRYPSDLLIEPAEPGPVTGGDEPPPGDASRETWLDVSLAEVRALPAGTRVRFEAQITAPPGVLGDTRAYVGTSDAGLALHLTEGGYPSLQEGDRVRVRGKLDTFHGERILRLAKGADVEWLGPGVALQPRAAVTGELGAHLEGRLVAVVARIKQRQWPTLYVDDGSGEARVRILDDTGIPKLDGGAGDVVSATGIVSQWDGRYRLLPRYGADILATAQVGGGAGEDTDGDTHAGTPGTPDTVEPSYRDVTLAHSRTLPLGMKVRFEARVTAPPSVLGEARAYVGDEMTGIALHLPSGGYPSLTEGDRVRVQGELDTYHGERIVRLESGADVFWLESGTPVPALAVQTGAIGAGTEGRLVTVQAPIAQRQWPTLRIDDGTGEARVRVVDTTGIPKLRGSRGDVAVVTGLVSQWDGRWRVLPRWPRDIEIAVIATVPRSGAGGKNYSRHVAGSCPDAQVLPKHWQFRFYGDGEGVLSSHRGRGE